MEHAIAQAVLQHAGAFDDQAQIELIGHANAAVQLHGFVGQLFAQVRCPRLGQAGQQGHIRRAFVNRRQRSAHAAVQHFQLGIEPRHAVLQRLERANRHIKLHPLFQVGIGAVKRLAGNAQTFGGQANAGAVQRCVQRLGSVGSGVQVHVVSHFNRFESDARVVAAVGQQRRLQRDAGLRSLDHEQADVSAAINARHDDQRSSADAVDHKRLVAVQHPAIALRVALGAGFDALGVVAAGFVQRQRQALLAVDQTRQPALALGLAAGGQQQLAAQHHGRQQRQRGQCASHRFKHRAKPHVTHAQAVVLLREHGGRPA